MVPCAASRCTTISLIIRRRSARRWQACGRHTRDTRIWAIFEPRSATSCRRVFQSEFARALIDGGSGDSAGRVPVVAARGRTPFHRTAGQGSRSRRRQCPVHPADRRHRRQPLSREGWDGDLVVIMSNGGFDDIHQKLLAALERGAEPLDTMGPFRIHSAGDAAVVVELPEAIDPEVNAWCVALSRALTTHASARSLATSSSAIARSPSTLTRLPWMRNGSRREIGERRQPDVTTVTEGGAVEVPVCYGGDVGPDLADVAAFAGCSEAEAIALHASREYRVYLVGFVPGFAYMAEVDPRIAAPRRSSPRTAVPAGSVAIAGGQTGVYPRVTPGGWNIIGRTPLQPFDPDSARAVSVQARRPRSVSSDLDEREFAGRDAGAFRRSSRHVDDRSGPGPLGISGERRSGRRPDGRIFAPCSPIGSSAICRRPRRSRSR